MTDPGNPEFLKERGNSQKARGDLEAAVESYRSALAIAPDYAAARYNLGLTLRELNRLEEAEVEFRRIHEQDPRDVDALFNLAALLALRARYSESAARFRAALDLAPDNPYLCLELALVLRRIPGQLEASLKSLGRCLEIKPDFADAHNALANIFQGEGRLDEAIEHYRSALKSAPHDAPVHVNLGNALAKKSRLDEAVRCYREAARLDPKLADAFLNLGSIHGLTGDYVEALRCFETVLKLQPDNVVAQGCLLYEMQRACDWSRFDELARAQCHSAATRPEYEVVPFHLLSIPSTPAEQLQCAGNYAQRRLQEVARDRERLNFRHERKAKARLRIGYLSADFREHPGAHLIAELIELHDRARFEIIGYSYGPDDGSAIRSRLRRAFDRFIDLSALSHADAAARIHGDGTDILMDLSGYTTYARTEILALRPAPVQVNYLGYPGTMGADYVDYLIADRFIAPPGQVHHFSEKPVLMPGSYQANDRKRDVADTPTRRELGLPEGAFVFCCLNQTSKILPDVYAAWMRLLKALPGSVIWLVDTSPLAVSNLRREAMKHGIGPERLVFAPRVPIAQHLGRLRAADLFLDTFPYNAHTTASDALWVGLPVLTRAGETFASRVGGSLLTAVGLPELITRSLEEYEALALRLARAPAELAALREKLARNRDITELFNTPAYARHLESAFLRMWENDLAGNAPRALTI
jgi:predicted O-linked N-acetylglucosamine transferase (SPINDLY family)